MIRNLFKYEFLSGIRQKEVIFWMMCFPIILSTLFNLAFSNLYEKDEMFAEIPVAVVEEKSDEAFRTVMEQLSTGDSPLFTVQYTDRDEAMELLEKKKISGIIYAGDELSMAVSGKGIVPTIIRSFLEQYTYQKKIIVETAMNAPDKLPAVIETLSAEIDCIDTKELTSGNMDVYASYFQNLIAMVALFGTTSGIFAATSNQGNLSAIGARKCVSPVHKLKAIIVKLSASICVQSLCTFISISYILFILRIDMGDKIPMIYLSGILGSVLGVSLGFFIGSATSASESAKLGMTMGISMTSCFLSGLMVGNMKAVIEEKCPVINVFNPASIISDLFYCLSIYDDYIRYIERAVLLLIMSVVFAAGGFLMTRRKKYASI